MTCYKTHTHMERGHLPPTREAPEEVLKLDRNQIVVRSYVGGGSSRLSGRLPDMRYDLPLSELQSGPLVIPYVGAHGLSDAQTQ